MYLKSDERLVAVRPSSRQLNQQEMEFYGFIHYGMNTYTDREWGDGTEPEEWFSPALVNTDQWAKTARAAGMKGLILTCKHHDGFCLWPSAYTEHSVKNSPYLDGKGDIVKQTAESCQKFGIRFGVYLSPWDRHERTYGSGKAYDDYYVNQLTELLTGYGDIFCVWMDGACGEGPDGRVQNYDWDRYYNTVRRFQPCACISVCGPDIRWCGNEAGDTRESEWNVVPARMADAKATAKRSQQEDNGDFRERPISKQDSDLGSRSRLEGEESLVWYPAEVDMSIRPGWFYHKAEDQKVCTLERLKEVYLRSVGGNAMLLLNLPPDKQGQLAQPDVEMLFAFGRFLDKTFSCNLAAYADITADSELPEHPVRSLLVDNEYFGTASGITQVSVTLKWKEIQRIRYIVLQEYLELGQRVEKFEISVEDEETGRQVLAKGTVIGQKRIVFLEKTVSTSNLTIQIYDSRVSIALRSLAVYGD